MAGKYDIGSLLLKFADLAGRESSFRPLDTNLARFERKRYSVIGRPGEETVAGTALDGIEAFNATYLHCEPGKGVGAHAHDTTEVFIAMSGRWSVTLGEAGEEVAVLEPWDIISVPPGEMHGAVNISDDDGWLMTINAGNQGAEIHWAPDLVAEVRRAGIAAEASEVPAARKK